MRILLLLLPIIVNSCALKDSNVDIFTRFFWPDITNPKISLVEIINSEKILENRSFLKKFFGIEPDVTIMHRPFAIAADDEYVAISDLQFGMIFLIDKKNYSLTTISSLKGRSFKSVVNLDIKDKKLYIVDSDSNIIGLYDILNKKEHIFNIQTEKPVAIKVDNLNKLMFIVDIKRDIVVITDLEGNISGEIKGDMNYPIDIDIIPSKKRLYILDAFNHRVKIYGYNGNFEKSFGSIGNKPGYFARPKGLCVDQYSRVYITDAEFDNIQIFNSEGELLYFIGGNGIEFAKFNMIGKVYCYKNEILASDIFNSRVQIFNSFE
ncbi:MAG: hypothetical protein LDL13_06385 [Calditerrivibrio sp.]|nr:hypothetical protein [Calditerrivibrio sp.]